MRAKALALTFLARKTIFYLPHTPPTPPQLISFPFLILLFIFDIHPRPHLLYIEPTSTLHGPHTDPTPTTTTFLLFSLHHHHHISTAFFPPPPPPTTTPHFYCYSSTTTTTFLLFSFFTTFPLFFPPLPPHFYCFTSSL